MAIKEGFKQTEIGFMPEDWEVKPLQQITTEIGDGIHTTPIYSNNSDFFFINGNNLYDGEIRITEDTLCIPINEYKKYKPKLGNNSILVSINGTIGNLAYFNNEKVVLGKSAAYINVQDTVEKDFIYYVLASYATHNYFDNELTGTTIRNLSLYSLRNTPIPLPPLPEQHAIAEVLSDVDALIASLDALIAKKRAIKQGVMGELLRPNTNWNETTLFGLADEKKELFDDGDWIEAEHIKNEGIRLIQTGNIGIGHFIEKQTKKYINEDSYEKLNCKELFEGDLLICRLAEPAGRACVLPNIGENKVITSVDVTIFRPLASLANRVFLSYVFSTDKWFRNISEMSGGTTHKRISRSVLGQIKIKVPCVKEQNKIAKILLDIDLEIISLDQKISKIRLVKQGMMQELLTGRIRLMGG